MLVGVIATVIGGMVTIGLITLVVFLGKLHQVDKSHPDRRSQVRFNPRGFLGVVMFVGAIGVFFWIVLLLASSIDLPSWVFSVGFVFLVMSLRSVMIKVCGEMFVVDGAGGTPGGKVTAAGGGASPAQYPGFNNAPVQNGAPVQDSARTGYYTPTGYIPPARYAPPADGTPDPGSGHPGKG